jgi:hypothetical protein
MHTVVKKRRIRNTADRILRDLSKTSRPGKRVIFTKGVFVQNKACGVVYP